MDIQNLDTEELYAELMRRGNSWRYDWAIHVVALSRSLKLLERCVVDSGGPAGEELARIKTMLGPGFNPRLVLEAERVAKRGAE
jgi:hypothetical protein